MESPSTTKMLKCVVVTPEKAVLDELAEFIVIPMYDGELGVLPGRTPLIGRLGYGELRSVKGKDVHRYFIDGGFVQIRGNVVTVLTPKAVKAENIDVGKVETALQEAKKVTGSEEAQEQQLKDQQRARAQLRVAHKVRGED